MSRKLQHRLLMPAFLNFSRAINSDSARKRAGWN
jgi:hypothetical protein